MFSLGFDWFNVWFGSCTFLSLGDSILDQCFLIFMVLLFYSLAEKEISTLKKVRA